MKLFLSYASEDKDIAEQVYFALMGDNHHVFFDRTSLPPGGDYNTRIRQAVLDSDLFIFLISDASVAESSYALTELMFARRKWPHPGEFVIPVMIRRTDYGTIPNYLKAVTILEPRGSISAEVASEIAKIAESKRGKSLRDCGTYVLKHWPVTAAALAVVGTLSLVILDTGKIDEGSAESALLQEIQELREKVNKMEAESIRMQNDYRSLQLSLANLAGVGGEELSAQFRQDLVSEVEVLSAGMPEAEIGAVLGDPSLTDEEKGARVVELISTNLQALDREIERQAQLLQTQRDSPSLDVETMKLKRMIDKRSQTFDALRQIIDRYNQTAKGIIDSIGR